MVSFTIAKQLLSLLSRSRFSVTTSVGEFAHQLERLPLELLSQ